MEDTVTITCEECGNSEQIALKVYNDFMQLEQALKDEFGDSIQIKQTCSQCDKAKNESM